jgi:serine/threonine-protein kinase
VFPKVLGYEIVQHLASGGMGRVYLARSQPGPGGFERHVVLKMLDLEAPADDPRVAMFLDEARVIGRMYHHHIAPAFTVGRDQDGRFYLAMEYIHGHSAATVWERTLDLDTALPLDFGVTVVAAAASALGYAHSRTGGDGKRLGIVHRDVSLSNLMIGYDGAIKLIDFGIAKTRDASQKTQVGFVKGKIGYMAPEQVRGGVVDGRTDIFALGIVLYELTTMNRAFRDESDFDTIERIKKGSYVPPSELVTGFPAELERIIATALHVAPSKRYQEADELRRDLASYGHRNRLVIGDAAIIEVMFQLFDDREEPWCMDGAPRAVDDNNATIPVDTTIEPVQRRHKTPRPLVEHLRAASDVALSDLDSDTPTTLGPAPRHSSSARQSPAVRPSPVPATKKPPFKPPKPTMRTRAPAEPRARKGPSTRRLGWLAPLAAGVAVAWVVAGDLEREHGDAAPSTRAGPADAALADAEIDVRPTDAAIDAPVDALPAKVRIQITTKPADATVLLDGARLGRTPLDIEVDAKLDDKIHAIKIRRKGYVTEKLDVVLTADVIHEVTLEPDR